MTTKIGSGATPKGGSEAYLPARQTFAFVRSQNVFDRRFDGSALAFITDEQAKGLRGVVLQPGDVLLNITGDGVTFGRAALVDESVLPACVNQHVSIVRADPEKADPGYLLAFLTHPDVKPYIASFNSGGSRRAVTKGNIESFRVPLPPIETQRAIAATLGTLDDKIESNGRLIDIIPRLTRAQVDAVLDGGNEVPVASLATFVNGGAYTKGATGTGRMVLRIAELNSGPRNSTVYNDIEVPESKTARPGDILMSWSGSLGVYRWFRSEAIINQHIFKVIPTGYPAWLVFDRLNAVMPVFQGVAKDKATTMGHIQRGHLESTKIAVPSLDSIRRLDAALGPLWDQLLLAERENVALTAVRDALLPELLSGRIRVPAEVIA
ncbi:restriction endonuclease subunit S [Mycolicibacterium boenickei]